VPRAVTPTVGRLLGWPTSINSPAAITLGTGLSLAGSTLNATASSAWADLTGVPANLTSWAAITRASGMDTFTATPTLANLSALVSDANIARTDAAQTLAGVQTLSDTTASTGTGTGALQVAGGIAAAKDSFFNGIKIGRGAGNNELNIVVGVNTLALNTTGTQNVAIGYDALYSNTTGVNNVAIGFSSLYANTTGYGNTTNGAGALYLNTTGINNVGIGGASDYSNTTGNNNVGIGLAALYSNSTGSGNIALGFNAGYYETGSNSFYINNQDRTNLAGDQTLSLLYGTFAATATAQQLTVNAGTLNVDGGTTGGKIALRETNTNGEHVTGFIAPSSLAADVIYTLPTTDGTNGQALVTNGSGTLSFATIASGATLAANTFTGLQQFSGTTHAGIRLNNLTTAERDALTGAAGMAIWNTTDGRLQLHNGSAWTSGMVRLSGDTMTGALVINAASGFTGRILDAQVNGVTKGHFTHDGRVVLSADTFNNFSTPVVQTGSGRGLCTTGGSLLNVAAGSVDCLGISPTSITTGSGQRLGFSSATTPGASDAETFFMRDSTSVIQMGADTATNSATATGQTLKAPDATGTTSTGGSLTLQGGNGTSSGGAVIIRTAATTTQTERARFSSAGVTIGASGTAIASVISATGTLDFPSTNAHSASALTITVTGAAVGDVVALGIPTEAIGTNGVFFGYVSAADTVTVRFCNTDSGPAVDPASGTFRATVIKH
jgi:hypothetical protein